MNTTALSIYELSPKGERRSTATDPLSTTKSAFPFDDWEDDLMREDLAIDAERNLLLLTCNVNLDDIDLDLIPIEFMDETSSNDLVSEEEDNSCYGTSSNKRVRTSKSRRRIIGPGKEGDGLSHREKGELEPVIKNNSSPSCSIFGVPHPGGSKKRKQSNSGTTRSISSGNELNSNEASSSQGLLSIVGASSSYGAFPALSELKSKFLEAQIQSVTTRLAVSMERSAFSRQLVDKEASKIVAYTKYTYLLGMHNC